MKNTLTKEWAIIKLNQFKESGVELFANAKAYKEKLARLEVNVFIAN